LARRIVGRVGRDHLASPLAERVEHRRVISVIVVVVIASLATLVVMFGK
jgi:hypothetical protein